VSGRCGAEPALTDPLVMLPELLDVLAEFAQPLPSPASYADYPRKVDLDATRHIILQTRLISLADQLAVGDQYPNVAAECLAAYCHRATASVRKHLAQPLGYEPEVTKEDPSEDQ
jgi:hypothetical protein